MAIIPFMTPFPSCFFQGGDDDDGEAFDLSKMEREEGDEDEDDNVKVHEIKFDEFGIMDDGVDESTAAQLKAMQASE